MISDFLSNFNALDYIIVLTLIISFIKGFLVGGVDKIFKITGIVLAIYIALNYSSPISNFIMRELGIENKVITTTVVVIMSSSIVLSAFHFMANRSTAILKALGLDLINRSIGAVLGVIIVIILWSGLFVIIDNLDDSPSKIIRNSTIKNLLTNPSSAYKLNIVESIPEGLKNTGIIKKKIKENAIIMP